MSSIISISNLTKTYASGVQALKPVSLEIKRGEIFALLGPNGAGKTTLINIVCGIVTSSGGTVLADGHDIVRDYRLARMKIGLVPQELHTDAFETVLHTVSFSRGLYGRPRNPEFIEKVLRDLTLWDKRNAMIDLLFAQQKNWAFTDKPFQGLSTLVRQTGMSQDTFETCLKDQKLYDNVNAVRDLAAQKFSVDATPTFFINGKKAAGEMTIQEMAKLFAPYLKS